MHILHQDHVRDRQWTLYPVQ